MKFGWKYVVVLFAVSLIVVGTITNFSFQDISFQWRNRLEEISALRLVIAIAFILHMTYSGLELVVLLSNRYLMFALFVAVLIPLIALFTGFVFLWVVENLSASRVIQVTLVSVFAFIFLVLTTIEVRTIKLLFRVK